MRAIAPFALVLLVAVPATVAAASAPAEGSLVLPEGARLSGRAVFATEDGLLDATPLARATGNVPLAWAQAGGNLSRAWWTLVRTGAVDAKLNADARVEPLHGGPARVVAVECAAGCQVLLLGMGGGGRLTYEGDVDSPVAWTRTQTRHWAEWSDGRGAAFLRETPAGSFSVSDLPLPDGIRLAGGRPGAEGRIGLFLANASLTLETPDGARAVLDARLRREPVAGPPGAAPADHVESRFALLTLEGARLDAPAGAGARLLAASPTLALRGALAADAAEGSLRYDGETHRPRGAPVAVEGNLTLAPRVRDGAVARVGPASLLGDRELEMDVSGDVERLRVGGVTRESGAGALAQGAGGATAAAGLAWLLRRALLAALYSRIARGRVLANPNREAIHRLVCEEPGVTAAELRRRTGLARVVVQHHLRVLEAHRLVLRRRDGRRKRCYPAAGAPGEAAFAAEAVLRDATRRRVVEALAAAPGGLNQKELARATGLSARLVSYHLARLREAGVVREEGRRPRRYRARDPAAGSLTGSCSMDAAG